MPGYYNGQIPPQPVQPVTPPPTPVQAQPIPSAMKCRAVTSQEEARAAMIDLDGSVSVFTDFGNNKIYTKQIKLDGTAELKTYELVKESAPQAEVPMPNMREYVRQVELDDMCDHLTNKIYDLEQSINELKKTAEKTAKGAKK